MDNEKQAHWEKVYDTKDDNEVSWYQAVPGTSLALVTEFAKGSDAQIIDVGGGNSNLVKELLDKGYQELSVLDISVKALERTQAKLANKAEKVNWIVSDVLDMKLTTQYDVWHDRATFHFLTNKDEVAQYVDLVTESIASGGYLILATFSTNGPFKCSGLEITQYDAAGMEQLFGDAFDLVRSFTELHQTPFDTQQEFTFAVFKRKA